MVSTSETGHAVNVGNFETLITKSISYGTAYNPTNPLHVIANMNVQLSDAKTAVAQYNAANGANTPVINIRSDSFAKMNTLLTRINSNVKACGTSKSNIASVQSLVTQCRGARVGNKATDEEKATAKAAGNEIKNSSTSQLSFNNRLSNFSKLVQLLASIPEYKPNETDLTLEALNAFLADLSTKNTAANTSETTVDNLRAAQNKILYTDITGLSDVGNSAKLYIKSVFGVDSPEYKAVSTLTFRNLKR